MSSGRARDCQSKGERKNSTMPTRPLSPRLKLPTVTTKTADILTKELRESTQKDSITSANALQTWLHD